MVNVITSIKVNNQTILMSNLNTSHFLKTICLGGADIAIENYQKDLMIWFAQHDWNIRGLGCEGFDVCEIIWDKQRFNEQKKFILKVIDSTIDKTNWDLLHYTPPEEWLFGKLSDFRIMINNFNEEHIEPDEEEELFAFDDKVRLYEKCDKHKVYKHWYGCIICDDQVEDAAPNLRSAASGRKVSLAKQVGSAIGRLIRWFTRNTH